MESLASIKLVSRLKALGHINPFIKSDGLFDDQFLGVSPDSIVTCDCCPERKAEVKCPTTPLSRYQYIKEGKLEKKDSYKQQVQGQMITGMKYL